LGLGAADGLTEADLGLDQIGHGVVLPMRLFFGVHQATGRGHARSKKDG